MSLTVSDPGGGNFVPAPEGTHVARCVQVIDLGTQTSGFYKDQHTGEPKKARKVMLGWELPTELQEDNGEPFLVWGRYTSSLHEKSNLRKVLEGWRGRKFSEEELHGFHLKNVLDKPCLINIIHNESGDRVFANVSAVMAMPKGQHAPPRAHELIVFDVDAFDKATFEKFSENLQKTIKACDELRARNPEDYPDPPVGTPHDDEEVPF